MPVTRALPHATWPLTDVRFPLTMRLKFLASALVHGRALAIPNWVKLALPLIATRPPNWPFWMVALPKRKVSKDWAPLKRAVVQLPGPMTGEPTTVGDGEADADGEAVGDGEADADADAEAEGEADLLGEPEADTDGEADLLGDADAEAEAEADTEGEAEAEADAEGEGDLLAAGEADADAEGDGSLLADAEAEAEGTVEAEAEAEAEAAAEGEGERLADAEADAEADGFSAALGDWAEARAANEKRRSMPQNGAETLCRLRDIMIEEERVW